MNSAGHRSRDRILEFIREHIAEHGYPPTVREICDAVGLWSTATVHTHLHILEASGRLVVKRNGHITKSMHLVETPEPKETPDAEHQAI